MHNTSTWEGRSSSIAPLTKPEPIQHNPRVGGSFGIDDNSVQALRFHDSRYSSVLHRSLEKRKGYTYLERVNGYPRSVCIQLLLCTLVVVSPALEFEAHTVGYVFDPLGPDLLVQLRVKSDIRGTHVLSGEFDDRLCGEKSKESINGLVSCV